VTQLGVFLASFSVAPVAATALVFAILTSHEHTQAESPVSFQTWLAAQRLREEVYAREGVFPAPGEEVDRLIESLSMAPPHACIGPIRYERIDEAGTRARIFALGDDGAPGGSGCDADIGCWIDSAGAYLLSDARELPAQWR
jgi:hypothetical protein